MALFELRPRIDSKNARQNAPHIHLQVTSNLWAHLVGMAGRDLHRVAFFCRVYRSDAENIPCEGRPITIFAITLIFD